MPGFGESLRDVAVAHVKFGQQIVGRAAVHQRRAGGERVAAIGGDWQGLIVNVEQRRGVLCDIAVVGNDHGNGLANVHHLVDCQNRAVQVLDETRAR